MIKRTWNRAWSFIMHTYFAAAAIALIIWFFVSLLALWTVYQMERGSRKIAAKVKRRRNKSERSSV